MFLRTSEYRVHRTTLKTRRSIFFFYQNVHLNNSFFIWVVLSCSISGSKHTSFWRRKLVIIARMTSKDIIMLNVKCLFGDVSVTFLYKVLMTLRKVIYRSEMSSLACDLFLSFCRHFHVIFGHLFVILVIFCQNPTKIFTSKWRVLATWH